MEGIGIMVLSNKQIMIIINDLKNEYRGICYRNIKDRENLCITINNRFSDTIYTLYCSCLLNRIQYNFMLQKMQKMYKQNTSF